MDLSPAFLGLGLVFVLIGAVIFLMGISKKWGILFPFFGLLLFSSMSRPEDWKGRLVYTVWQPIQSKRSTLFLAMGVVGLMMLLLQIGRLRGKAFSLSAVMLLTMGFYAALLRFVHESPSDGAFSVLFSACTLIPLFFTASLSVDEPSDFLLFLRTTVLMNIVWMGMCFIQLVINPTHLTLGNQFRFVGILSNPQHSGALLAFLSVFVLWLLLNDPQKKYRLIYMALISVNVLCLMWTGSRTGLGMAIIGVSAVLYTKAGRGILVLPVVAFFAYIGMNFVIHTLGIDFGISRLVSTENTRDAAWLKLYSVGIENPIFGVGTQESEKSENSWLFGFAAFGIGMLALTIVFTFAAIWECLRMIRMRYWLPVYYRPYSDLIVGGIAMYFAGAVLEGYMVSRVNAMLSLYLPIAMMGAMFRRFAQQYHDTGYLDGDTDSGLEFGEDTGDAEYTNPEYSDY